LYWVKEVDIEMENFEDGFFIFIGYPKIKDE
jgi:hypothetical protein